MPDPLCWRVEGIPTRDEWEVPVLVYSIAARWQYFKLFVMVLTKTWRQTFLPQYLTSLSSNGLINLDTFNNNTKRSVEIHFQTKY